MNAVAGEEQHYFRGALMFVLGVDIAGRICDRANNFAYDSFCFTGGRAIVDRRNHCHGRQPLERKSSRRISDARAGSAASSCPGDMGGRYW
jgi:hypothetical protein